jgi:DNA invertase Pin-like site-specific DNA recombinase
MKPIVAYYRVSTQKQARSGKKGLGLGLEAQREALERFAQANGLQIVTEFTEIETGKGAEALELRPQLASALNMARKRSTRQNGVVRRHSPPRSLSRRSKRRFTARLKLKR